MKQKRLKYFKLLNKYIKKLTCDKPVRDQFELENLLENQSNNTDDFRFVGSFSYNIKVTIKYNKA